MKNIINKLNIKLLIFILSLIFFTSLYLGFILYEFIGIYSLIIPNIGYFISIYISLIRYKHDINK